MSLQVNVHGCHAVLSIWIFTQGQITRTSSEQKTSPHCGHIKCHIIDGESWAAVRLCVHDLICWAAAKRKWCGECVGCHFICYEVGVGNNHMLCPKCWSENSAAERHCVSDLMWWAAAKREWFGACVRCHFNCYVVGVGKKTHVVSENLSESWSAESHCVHDMFVTTTIADRHVHKQQTR